MSDKKSKVSSKKRKHASQPKVRTVELKQHPASAPEQAKATQEQAVHSSKLVIPQHEEDTRVILNVGGTIFETYTSTLKKYPDTLLGALFTNRPPEIFEEKNVDEDHRFFFDRDPRVFEAILNFYRTGKLIVPSWMPHQLVAEEMKFFALKLATPDDPLVAQLDLMNSFVNTLVNAAEYKRVSRARLLEEHHNTLIQIVAEISFKMKDAATRGFNFCEVSFYSPLHYTDFTPNYIFNVISKNEIRELIMELFNEKGFHVESSKEYSKTVVGKGPSSDCVTNYNDPKRFSFSIKW